MTISGTYSQSLSIAFAVDQTGGTSASEAAIARAAAVLARTSPSAVADRVELSSQATAAAGFAYAPVDRSETLRRSEALFRALDTDRNGSISRQEFTEGEAALLRRAGALGGGQPPVFDQIRAGDPAPRGPEKVLEGLFARVDVNQDDALDQDELTAALEAETPPSAVADPSQASQRGSSLFGALDADRSGSVTQQEFTDGAATILRQAGVEYRDRTGQRGADQPSQADRAERLGKRLEDVFARVDANHDGAVDQKELIEALQQADARQLARTSTRADGGASLAPASAAAPSVDAAQTFGSFSVTQVTTFSFAIQQYAAEQSSSSAAPRTLDEAA